MCTFFAPLFIQFAVCHLYKYLDSLRPAVLLYLEAMLHDHDLHELRSAVLLYLERHQKSTQYYRILSHNMVK